jgi:hypothetical protein
MLVKFLTLLKNSVLKLRETTDVRRKIPITFPLKNSWLSAPPPPNHSSAFVLPGAGDNSNRLWRFCQSKFLHFQDNNLHRNNWKSVTTGSDISATAMTTIPRILIYSKGRAPFKNYSLLFTSRCSHGEWFGRGDLTHNLTTIIRMTECCNL